MHDKIAISRIDRRPTRGWDVDKIRTSRACSYCRSRKVKCTGEIQCQRCIVDGKACVYDQRRKKRSQNSITPAQQRRVASLLSDLHGRIAPEDQQQLEEFMGQLSELPAPITGRTGGDALKNASKCPAGGIQSETRVETYSVESNTENYELNDYFSDNIVSDVIVQDKPARIAIVQEPCDPVPRSNRPEMFPMDSSTLLQVLWYMQTESAIDAHEFLEIANSQSVLDGYSQWLESRGEHLDKFTQATRLQDSSHQSKACPTIQPTVEARPKERRISHDTTIGTVKLAVDVFFKSTCLLFYTIPSEQVEAILDGDFQMDNDTPFVYVLKRANTLQRKARLAELCGMAAVGVVFLREREDGEIPPAQLGDFLYCITKQLLDCAIEVNPFRAMKVCALLCMYNIFNKARVATAFVEFGLGLAKSHKLDEQYPAKMTVEEYLDHRRTWRTLVCFSNWLAASIGYSPAQAASNLHILQTEKENLNEDVVQRELVKVTIIKAKILSVILGNDPIADSEMDVFQKELRTLNEELPEWMNTKSLLAKQETTSLRRAVMYYHAFFLSATQLLYRLPMANLLYMQSVYVRPATESAVREGLLAARLAARLFSVMKDEGIIRRICWMCIYCSYATGLILLQSVAQKIITGTPGWASDIDLAKHCAGVLRFCAELDKVAMALETVLSSYVEVILEQSGERLAPNADEGPGENETVDYLFTIPGGDSVMDKAARDLLRLVQNPFERSLELISQGVLQPPPSQANMVNLSAAGMANPMEWSWEMQHCGLASSTEAHPEEPLQTGLRTIIEIDAGHFRAGKNESPWTVWTRPVS
ncbi:hypothetical protein EJ04DRAFT_519958 [Polyplosphaeria fusca]|uniref:Zn(2)-C6 fungal-type domain-containing protein n=1 Tax=Polyplosphaeria fusca TaxID=682080 RepID=A0A9P4R905_9PLEO|nr:hypothetical protein EJ04DRAFT_519958 [Polyplosphaeria fusca]